MINGRQTFEHGWIDPRGCDMGQSKWLCRWCWKERASYFWLAALIAPWLIGFWKIAGWTVRWLVSLGWL